MTTACVLLIQERIPARLRSAIREAAGFRPATALPHLYEKLSLRPPQRFGVGAQSIFSLRRQIVSPLVMKS